MQAAAFATLRALRHTASAAPAAARSCGLDRLCGAAGRADALQQQPRWASSTAGAPGAQAPPAEPTASTGRQQAASAAGVGALDPFTQALQHKAEQQLLHILQSQARVPLQATGGPAKPQHEGGGPSEGGGNDSDADAEEQEEEEVSGAGGGCAVARRRLVSGLGVGVGGCASQGGWQLVFVCRICRPSVR